MCSTMHDAYIDLLQRHWMKQTHTQATVMRRQQHCHWRQAEACGQALFTALIKALQVSPAEAGLSSGSSVDRKSVRQVLASYHVSPCMLPIDSGKLPIEQRAACQNQWAARKS